MIQTTECRIPTYLIHRPIVYLKEMTRLTFSFVNSRTRKNTRSEIREFLIAFKHPEQYTIVRPKQSDKNPKPIPQSNPQKSQQDSDHPRSVPKKRSNNPPPNPPKNYTPQQPAGGTLPYPHNKTKASADAQSAGARRHFRVRCRVKLIPFERSREKTRAPRVKGAR